MDWLAVARRRAFSEWLRTGRLPRWARPAAPEIKYNPWHDPDDGRFTFTGTGRYFAPGGAAKLTPTARMSERPKEPKNQPYGGYGGGGRGFSGGGASGSWDEPEPKREQDRAVARQEARNPGIQGQQNPASSNAARNRRNNWRTIEINGYEWSFDLNDLFRQVEGTLVFSEAPRRSRIAQSRAGLPDRRPNDDGGHYVAPRFNGPTDAFNHFAQDRNFNRGAYRALEDQWARALKAGKRVDVRIVPVYEGASRRPSYINVWFWIDGHLESQKFPNEPQGRNNAKR